MKKIDHGDGSLIINFPEIHIESREIFCVRFEYDRYLAYLRHLPLRPHVPPLNMACSAWTAETGRK